MLNAKRLQGLLPSRQVDNGIRNTYKGSTLILVLWSLSLLTIFALSLEFGVRQKLIMVGRLDDRDSLHFIAEAGIKRAILELRKDAKEPWNNNMGIFKEIEVGRGTFTVSYDYLNSLSRMSEVKYGIIDEERKVNINKAGRKVIERLFKICGIDEMKAQNLSASIVDWRDGDSELSIPFGSAEDRYYRNLSEPYEAKDADFEILDEIFLVREMTKEIFDKVKDFITVYGEGKININTAAPEVLLSLGLYERVVEKIVLFRCGQDLLEATADDNVFDSSSNVVAKLSQFCSLNTGEVANLSNLISAGKICTNSCNFMIKSIGKLNKKNVSNKIVCVFEHLIDGSDEGGKIKYWREEFLAIDNKENNEKRT